MKNEPTNIKLYYAIIGLLIVGFNVSMLLKAPLVVTIIILISLLLIIVFRNKAKALGNNKLVTATLALLGIVLTLTNHKIAFFYAACGVVSLTYIQISIASRSGKFILIGGKPTEKLDSKEQKVALYGLTLILSVALTFFAQVLILKASI